MLNEKIQDFLVTNSITKHCNLKIFVNLRIFMKPGASFEPVYVVVGTFYLEMWTNAIASNKKFTI